MQQGVDLLVTVLTLVAFLYSIIAHEVAHGWVALKCGDPTAKFAGRLTANPIPHIDPIMSVVVPLFAYLATGIPFGAAKGVPINLRHLRKMPRDHILVSLAGVATNLVIAIVCAGVVHLLIATSRTDTIGFRVVVATLFTNIGLLVFNLVPIPPLDGSRVFRYFLDLETRWKYDQLERWGFMIIIVLIQLPVFKQLLAWMNYAVLKLLGF
jgi:Zn-dependent protease